MPKSKSSKNAMSSIKRVIPDVKKDVGMGVGMVYNAMSSGIGMAATGVRRGVKGVRKITSTGGRKSRRSIKTKTRTTRTRTTRRRY